MEPILIARFWSKVEIGRDQDCWPWHAARDRYGYGQFKGQSYVSPRRAHRIAYELINGPIPDGLHIRHQCDNPACCNPGHLLPGTHADNMRDKAERGR